MRLRKEFCYIPYIQMGVLVNIPLPNILRLCTLFSFITFWEPFHVLKIVKFTIPDIVEKFHFEPCRTLFCKLLKKTHHGRQCIKAITTERWDIIQFNAKSNNDECHQKVVYINDLSTFVTYSCLPLHCHWQLMKIPMMSVPWFLNQVIAYNHSKVVKTTKLKHFQNKINYNSSSVYEA